MRKLLSSVCAALFTALLIFSQPLSAAANKPVYVELIAEQSTVAAGQPFWVALKLDITDKWHVYWKNPGDAGFPPSVEWELPDGFTAGPLLWPTPERFVSGDFTGYGYHHEVTLLTQIIPPDTLESGKSVALKGHVQWVACSDQCLPGFQTLELSLPVTKTPTLAALEALNVLKHAKDKLPHSVWSVTAQHGQGGEIELNIRSGIAQRLLTASFLPDEAGLIDDGAEQTLKMREESPGHYVLTLQPSADSAGELSALKGLLVLNEPLMHDEHMQVLAVHLPLNNELFDRPPTPAKSEGPILTKDEPSLPTAGPAAAANTPRVTKEESSMPLGLALFFALLGGLILNLMPCVLPVISLKLFHFISIAKEKRSEILAHGAAFCAGVLLSFWVLASILLALKAYGHSVGWGFQLQDPRFVAFMIIVLFVFTLSLWGVFELGVGVAAEAGKLEGKAKGKVGTFFSGVLATFVATPCTGPFMGPVLGFAMGVPAYQALLVFTFMGLGMSLPYILCSAYPKLIAFLPKPGPWMNTFKQIMGFLMAASVLWLVWVFGAQTGNNALFLLFVGLLCFAVACWVYGRWALITRRGVQRNLVYGITLAFCAMGAFSSHMAANSPFASVNDGEKLTTAGRSAANWQPFSNSRLAQLSSEKKPVFIDFTAKWCITCQANKKVLNSEALSARFQKLGVVKMQADWTRRDPEITAALQKLGRAGVPVYVLYGRDHSKGPQILSSFPLTEGEVLQALDAIEVE